MSACMMIDPSGAVIRLHQVKKKPSFDSTSSSHCSIAEEDDLVCAQHENQQSIELAKPASTSTMTASTTTKDAENQPPPPRKCSTRKHTSQPFALKNLPWKKRPVSRDDSQSASTLDSSSIGNSSSIMDNKYAFLSSRFPITTSTEKVVMTRQSNNRDLVIRNAQGKRIGSMEYNSKERGIRILKDATKKTCAIIQKKEGEMDSCGVPSTVFRVYGDKPCAYGQKTTTFQQDTMVKGRYKWAEIKNVGSMSGKYVMRRCHSKDQQIYHAQRFGSLFSKTKSKGFRFLLDEGETECAKMISLGQSKRSKGIVIAPNQDMCLMLAFCAVVDEMAEQRLR